MALLNTGCLISTIQEDVTGITTGYAADCFTVIAAGVDGATQDRCVTVPTSGSLPSLYPTQTVPQGQVMFVEDVGVPVIAASGKWIGFDQRAFRYDFPTREMLNWGSNGYGRLGDGTTTNRSSPTSIAGGGVNWCALSAGCGHSAALKSDGTLWTWGYNTCARLGTGSFINRSSPGTTVGGGTNWCNVSVGGNSGAGIKTDGTLWTWGANNFGQLGDGTITLRSSPITVAGGGNNWSSVSVGYSSMAAIKSDGSLWTWGANSIGQLGTGNTTSRSSPGTTAGGGTTWCFISAGCDVMGAIKTDGTLWTWGRNCSGALGDGTISSRSSPGTVAGGGTTWCFISAAGYNGAAVKTDGTLWTWGANTYGSLGTGSSGLGSIRCSPGTTAGGGTNWCKVQIKNNSFAAAIKTDGTLWTWGINISGQLGTGTTTSRTSPGTVAGNITTWKDIFSGIDYTLAIRQL